MRTLIYGAYGYTGELISNEAVERGLDVVLAGRNGTKTRGLAAMLDTEARVFEAPEAGSNLNDVDLVLNCAGPFVETADPLASACLETGTHYLDITGEISVFESLAERDREAGRAGSCLLPGIGFDVVPTDCVAGHLHDRLPEATTLRLGFDGMGTISSGTAVSAIEHANSGGRIRRDGRLVDVPVGSERRRIDFGDGERYAMTIPWGDVVTAYYSTGIENVEVYVPMPRPVADAMQWLSPAMGVLEFEPVKLTLQTLAKLGMSGPSERQRERGRAFVWGEATDGDRTVTTRLRTPEPYALTVDAATTALERLAEMETAPVGYQTPSTAFDSEFVLELDDVDGFFDHEK